MYIPDNFALYEVLPKSYYERYIHKGDQLWCLFDERILQTAQALRNRYGKIIMNTWKWNGKHQYRGFREGSCPVGASRSQHKFGRALDLVFSGLTAEEVRCDIRGSIWQADFKFITCIEDKVSWLHIDCRNWDKEKKGLLIVNP